MYRFRGTGSRLSESAPPYRAGEDAPRFPADEVLGDLERATGEDAPVRIGRILARYAALRHWLLRASEAPEPVTDHARRAARAHLAASLEPQTGMSQATGGRPWAEGVLLLRTLGSRPERAAATLALAAEEARAAGDHGGAGALRSAARQAALLRLRSRRRPPGA